MRRLPKIMHSDISINNIMIRRKSGQMYGVLNDFDLARVPDRTSSSRQRTGTQPFMAMDLLEPSERQDKATDHLPRFDLESLFYVLLWRFCCPNNKQRQRVQLPPRPSTQTMEGVRLENSIFAQICTAFRSKISQGIR